MLSWGVVRKVLTTRAKQHDIWWHKCFGRGEAVRKQNKVKLSPSHPSLQQRQLVFKGKLKSNETMPIA